jgi:hypothetical protein
MTESGWRFCVRFLDRWFRHRVICVGRRCLCACLDHLEKSGRIEKQFRTPLIEGEQWEFAEESKV